jgi:hypothetical protein
MPLFGLSDISFNQQGPNGPLKELSKSSFEYNTYKYPIDLGQYDKGHYMMIYARKQEKSSYEYDTESFVDKKKNPNVQNDNSIGMSRSGTFGNYLKKTILTSDIIALYMPDTLLYQYNQTYSDVSLSDTLTGQAAAAGQSGIDAKIGSGLATFFSSLVKSGALTLAERKVGGGVTPAAFYGLTGTVKNPMLEMMYRSPNFRSFQFDFLFYPRDEKEALEVQKILERLRFHQAPEVSKSTTGSMEYGFLVPPSEFDIKFYYNGNENPNIPKIATCILEGININYAPNGFSAYEIQGQLSPSLGRTGMPVAIQLTLQFKEVTFLTKSDYVQNYDYPASV